MAVYRIGRTPGFHQERCFAYIL